jgi:PAS domain S-box-containing protein
MLHEKIAQNTTMDFLLDEKLLTSYRECPVCGGSKRSRLSMNFVADRYVGSVARFLEIPEQVLFDCLEAQMCSSCGATYFDPWFSVGLQRKLFEKLYPQHYAGWALFWSIIKNPSSVSERADLYQSFRHIIPNLKTYGEVGCPFTGLFPYLSVKEYIFKSKRFLDYPGAYTFDNSIGLHPRLGRFRQVCDRLSKGFVRSLNRFHLLRILALKRLIMRALVRWGVAQPIDREKIESYFIKCDSSISWGKNCKSLNVDCETVLQNVFGADVIGLEDIPLEKRRFDLIGIYNSLDHYKNPIHLLGRLFEFTDHIYLEGHHREGSNGKQHFYFLEPRTIRQLPKLLKMAEVVPEFKNRAAENHYSVLLRKKSRVPFVEQPKLIREEYEQLLEFVSDSVITRTPEGRISFWNRCAEELYGWRKEEAIGKLSHDLLQTQFPEPLEEIQAELIRSGRWEGRLVHATRDGRRVVVKSRWILDVKEQPETVVEINMRSTVPFNTPALGISSAILTNAAYSLV